MTTGIRVRNCFWVALALLFASAGLRSDSLLWGDPCDNQCNQWQWWGQKQNTLCYKWVIETTGNYHNTDTCISGGYVFQGDGTTTCGNPGGEHDQEV
jgi:hypothetical protein